MHHTKLECPFIYPRVYHRDCLFSRRTMCDCFFFTYTNPCIMCDCVTYVYIQQGHTTESNNMSLYKVYSIFVAFVNMLPVLLCCSSSYWRTCNLRSLKEFTFNAVIFFLRRECVNEDCICTTTVIIICIILKFSLWWTKFFHEVNSLTLEILWKVLHPDYFMKSIASDINWDC